MDDHENGHTLANSMLGALLAHVRQAAGDTGVERVRHEAGERRPVAQLQDPNEWSTYPQGLAIFAAAARVLDDPDVGRKAGVEVLRQYAGTEVLTTLRSLGSPAELLRVYPAISAKQSTVTRSEVFEVGDDHAFVSQVTTHPITRDPLFCGYTAGAISQFPVLFGMEPARVEERECQTRGDARCLFAITWDPTSSLQASPEREVEFLRERVGVLTTRFEALESVAQDLSSARDVDAMLETITRRAGVAVRAPRYLLVAQLPGDLAPRVHHVGFARAEVDDALREVLVADPTAEHGSRLLVEIASPRAHFGRLAAFYPDGYHFLPQERSLLMAYAGHAAAALETAAALDESRDRNATLGALLALGKALAQVRSRQEVAELLVHALPEIVAGEEAYVLLWDSGDAVLTRAAAARRSPISVPVPGVASLRDNRIVNRMLSTPSPTVATGISDPVLQGVLSLTGLSSAVVVPLSARDEFFGVLAVGPVADGAQPDDILTERLSGVASLAGTALDGARLLDEVRHQALHDPVTDLGNSRLFEDRVTHAITLARRSGAGHALMFIDLDCFKVINDTHGHKIGDEVLAGVAERLLRVVREVDTVARIGGDEFGVVLQDVRHPEDVESVAQKIVSAVGTPFTVRGLTLSVGASVGIAMFPEGLDTYDSVVSRADTAMYAAKAGGRGRYRFAAQRTRTT
ncbi:MAG TPA: diguanylate cyclase [Acidimicrobiales bacterium]|nr:diguanylate cyclase [Acidimicrobiales bacterium]